MDESAGTSADAAPAVTSLRALFARADDPYAGADIALARRFAVAMWAFGTLVALAMEIFFPPTRVLGDAGWLIAVAGFLTSFGFIAILADKKRTVGFDIL